MLRLAKERERWTYDPIRVGKVVVRQRNERDDSGSKAYCEADQ